MIIQLEKAFFTRHKTAGHYFTTKNEDATSKNDQTDQKREFTSAKWTQLFDLLQPHTSHYYHFIAYKMLIRYNVAHAMHTSLANLSFSVSFCASATTGGEGIVFRSNLVHLAGHCDPPLSVNTYFTWHDIPVVGVFYHKYSTCEWPSRKRFLRSDLSSSKVNVMIRPIITSNGRDIHLDGLASRITCFPYNARKTQLCMSAVVIFVKTGSKH